METVELLDQRRWRELCRELRRLQDESLINFGPTRESARLLEIYSHLQELNQSGDIIDYQI